MFPKCRPRQIFVAMPAEESTLLSQAMHHPSLFLEDNLVLLLQRVIDENSSLRETIEARDNEQKRILEKLSAKFESNSTSTPARNTGRKRKRSIAVSPQCRVSVFTLLSTIVIDQAKLSSVVCIVEVLRLHNVFNVLSLLIIYTHGCLRVLVYSEVPIWENSGEVTTQARAFWRF